MQHAVRRACSLGHRCDPNSQRQPLAGLSRIPRRLLQRWRAELSCALVMGDSQVYATALGGSGQGVRGLLPADVHVYELQPTGLPR